MCGKRGEHVNRFAPPTKEEVAIGLRHGGKAPIGRCVPPQIAGESAAAGCRVDHHREAFFRGRVGCDNPVQLAQKRQSRGRLAIEKHEHDWKIGFLHAAVERLVIFGDLPGSEPLLSDQQNEGRGLRLFPWRFPVASSRRRAGSWVRKRSAPRHPCAEAPSRTPVSARGPANCSSGTSAAFKPPRRSRYYAWGMTVLPMIP